MQTFAKLPQSRPSTTASARPPPEVASSCRSATTITVAWLTVAVDKAKTCADAPGRSVVCQLGTRVWAVRGHSRRAAGRPRHRAQSQGRADRCREGGEGSEGARPGADAALSRGRRRARSAYVHDLDHDH